MTVKKISPSKVNLMLAITGVRADGFHNLLSLVAPTDFGDELSVGILPEDAEGDTLECNMEGVPTDSSNLAMRAAELFRGASGARKRFAFKLDKRIPAGAGLGGGSGNGAVALAAMNELCGEPLDEAALCSLAAELGSDCPLFISGNPAVMRGRGDIVWPLEGEAKAAICRLKLFIFKPSFSINTAWAYSKMRENPSDYADPDAAEAMLSEWLENPSDISLPLFNNMQAEAFKKYPALEIMLDEIRAKFGVPALMSGSGSACFAVVNSLSDSDMASLEKIVRAGFGESCFTSFADFPEGVRCLGK